MYQETAASPAFTCSAAPAVAAKMADGEKVRQPHANVFAFAPLGQAGGATRCAGVRVRMRLVRGPVGPFLAGPRAYACALTSVQMGGRGCGRLLQRRIGRQRSRIRCGKRSSCWRSRRHASRPRGSSREPSSARAVRRTLSDRTTRAWHATRAPSAMQRSAAQMRAGMPHAPVPHAQCRTPGRNARL